ncbi:replication protein [Schleiferilactobacillus harbinensis]|nr:replication protein [Schleiferilactobacillus harbinensis]
MMVNHEPHKILVNGKLIEIAAGERLTSINKLATQWGATRRTVDRFLKLLADDDMISFNKSRENGTTLKVLHYADYQQFEAKSVKGSAQATAQGMAQRTTHKQEPKNDKNEKKEDSQHSRKREYADDSPEMIEAVYLWEKIKGNNPEHRKPNMQSWADDIRKMNELDHRPFEKIHKMIDWCQIDTFWQTNILSASKLRSKYDTMAAQANSKWQSRNRPINPKTAQPAWADPNYQSPDAKPTDLATKQRLAEQMAKLRENREKRKESTR